MKFRYIYYIFVSICLSCSCLAQDFLKGQGEFKIEIDYARFYGDSEQTYLEIYYGIRENILSYREDSGNWTGTVDMELKVVGDSSVVARKNWRIPHTLENLKRLESPQTMVGFQSLGLPAGRYRGRHTRSSGPGRRLTWARGSPPIALWRLRRRRSAPPPR